MLPNTTTEQRLKAAICRIRELEVAIQDIVDEQDNSTITVATYPDAVPYFTGTESRTIQVLADSTYYEGKASFYDYRPEYPDGKKVWFLGVDPDYLTNV